MAVPPAYQQVRYAPDPTSHLQAVGATRGPAAIPLPFGLGKGPEQRKAHRLARLGGGVAEDSPQRLVPSVRQNRPVNSRCRGIELIARTAIRPAMNPTPGSTAPAAPPRSSSPMWCWKTTAWC